MEITAPVPRCLIVLTDKLFDANTELVSIINCCKFNVKEVRYVKY